MIGRRAFLRGLVAAPVAIAATPAIVRAASLMKFPPRGLIHAEPVFLTPRPVDLSEIISSVLRERRGRIVETFRGNDPDPLFAYLKGR